VDVRADPNAITKLVAILRDLDFTDVRVSPEGFEHRFEKVTAAGVAVVDLGSSAPDTLVIDILGPEGLGERTDTRTSLGRAFPAPGSSQALRRTELVEVSYQGWRERIPRPDLLGAIVAKAAAATVDRVDPERHRTDLAFLLSLVDDPFALRANLKDHARLRAAADSLSEDSLTWNIAPRPDDARAALRILISVPDGGPPRT
jgi:hypothetical protein